MPAAESRRHVVVLSLHPLYDTRIGNHLETLVDSGYGVTYVNWSASREADWETSSEVTLIHRCSRESFGLDIRRYFAMWGWFWRQIRDLEADLVHLHDLLLLPLLLPCKLAARRLVVFDAHERYTAMGGRIGLFARLAYTLLPLADGLVAVSPATMPRSRKPRVVIPNYQRSAPSSAPPAGERRTVEIVYFGSLATEDRDIDLMLDVAERLLTSQPGIRFKIGGRLFGNRTERTRERLESLAVRHEEFHWLGRLPRRRVLDESRAADIGLWLMKDNPNLRGSSPNKIFEYLAGGIVVIATDGFEIASLVKARGAGEIVPPGIDAADLAARILRLVGDRERLTRMREASAELGERYRWEEVGERYPQLYERLWERRA